MKKEEVIKSIDVIPGTGFGFDYVVGRDGVTSIKEVYTYIDERNVSKAYVVRSNEKLIAEISANTPYVLTFE